MSSLSKKIPLICTFAFLVGCGAGAESSGPSGPIPEAFIPPRLNLEFQVDQARNNQGLAYANGFYYVGYDVGGGNGLLERYGKDGVLDASFGRVPVPTRHTAELAFRAADGRLYAASGGGTEPTFIYRLAADGKSVDRTYDFRELGNSALLAIDNAKDILIISSTKTGGDFGPPIFSLIDWNNGNRVISQFTLPYQGIPQGLEVYKDVIYYYTNNKITLLDYSGTILDEWQIKTTGESEGITLIQDGIDTYLAVGYNAPRRVYTIRPIKLEGPSAPQKHYVIGTE